MTGPGRARKRFGQHFLADESVISQMVSAIHPRRGEQLVEIGPGRGALTEALLDSAAELVAIELDRDLLPLLQKRFRERGNFRVLNGDALNFDYTSLAQPGKPLRIVGNLPYNISTPLIFHLLGFAEQIQDMYFMLQLEVVNRLAARPGNKNWGRLGIMAQYHCQVESLFEVAPHAFAPPPKVRSGVVRLRPHTGSGNDNQRRDRLQAVVRAAFSQRRKTLRNSLRDLVSVQQLQGLGISPSARAETLDLQQFLALSDLLEVHQ